MLIFLAVLVLWIAIGAAIGLHEARRGHWHGVWILGAIAGPLAVIPARLSREWEQSPHPEVIDLRPSDPGQGLRVLVGIDGSEESMHAARQAAQYVGWGLGGLTLATVLDFELVGIPRGDMPGADVPERKREEARAVLTRAADELGRWFGRLPSTVLLAGRPAQALAD